MDLDFNSLIPPMMAGAIALTVLFSEILKKADKNNIFKGYRVYFPLIFSALFTVLLWIAEIITGKQTFLYGFTIFGVSVFGYEAIIKKIATMLKPEDKTEETEK